MRAWPLSVSFLFLLAGCATTSHPILVEPKYTAGIPVPDRNLGSIVLATEIPIEWREGSPAWGILVLKGSGRKLLKLKPEPPSRDLPITHDLYSPDVRRDGLSVIYVENSIRLGKGDPVPSQTELREILIEGKKQRTIYTPPEGYFVASPTWSPAGDRIALLEYKDLVILDAVSFKEIQRITDVLLGCVTPWTQSLSLVWSEDGKSLFLDATSDSIRTENGVAKNGVRAIDLEPPAVQWLGIARPDMGWPCAWDQNPDQDPTAYRMPDVPAVRALFGPPNVCRDGKWSSGHRYFFYKMGSEGFFTSNWLEAYDVQRGKRLRIKTLGRRFYSE